MTQKGLAAGKLLIQYLELSSVGRHAMSISNVLSRGLRDTPQEVACSRSNILLEQYEFRWFLDPSKAGV